MQLRAETKEPAPLSARRSRPVLLLSAGLAVAFTVAAIVQDGGAAALTTAAQGAPELFDPEVSCPGEASNFHHHGLELESKALAKNERAPWRAQDGVEAALFLDQARACFAESGERERSRALSALLQRWQRKLRADYQRMRLRLELALRQAAEAEQAQGQVSAETTLEIVSHVAELQALLAHRDGPYLQWLNRVERQYAQTGEK